MGTKTFQGRKTQGNADAFSECLVKQLGRGTKLSSKGEVKEQADVNQSDQTRLSQAETDLTDQTRQKEEITEPGEQTTVY